MRPGGDSATQARWVCSQHDPGSYLPIVLAITLSLVTNAQQETQVRTNEFVLGFLVGFG
jgi:hypothetical protein